MDFLKQNIPVVRCMVDGDSHGTDVEQIWQGSCCHSRIINRSDQGIDLKEVVLFHGAMPFDAHTPIYGEAYNKLSQYGGTIGDIKAIGSFDEVTHYRLPQSQGYSIIYNMLACFPEGEDAVLMGFTSCHRFVGQFRVNKDHFEIVLDLEGITIEAGESLPLESFYADSGDHQALLEAFAHHITANHPMPKTTEVPTGWCSWLVYGPDITAKAIDDNMQAIKQKGLDLKYIQIDDGYQAYMGDWLTETDKFDGGMKELCLKIKGEGFEPAVWVAPFIAEGGSELFTNHPDWFIKDDDGKPLASDTVTFGGWRCGPWYMLDGTHPEARAHLTHVFKVMREEWRVTYFKLDAILWGALPFGHHHLPNKTSVEAFRMGMEAIREGAGEGSFLLGCNAPMWPSIGAVNGMRITNDNNRSWAIFRQLARECFPRNWQHGRLWVNDPDTVLLQNHMTNIMGPDAQFVNNKVAVTADEFMLNAAYTLASGGMALSSDDITTLQTENVEIMKRLLPPLGKAAVFTDRSYAVGEISMDGYDLLCLFNYEDESSTVTHPVGRSKQVVDFWSGDAVPLSGDALQLTLPPHSARVFKIK